MPQPPKKPIPRKKPAPPSKPKPPATRVFKSDNGVVYVTGIPVGWQIGSADLKPGAVYLIPTAAKITATTTYMIGVIPGAKVAAQSLAISITPPQLLKAGGGGLPLSIGSGANMLFVNGGVLCVSVGN